MKTNRTVGSYLIFELAVIVAFGLMLAPANGAGIFLLGPHVGLVAAVIAIFFNPIVGIIGIVIAGRELYLKNRKALVIVLLIVSIAFTALFPVTYVERHLGELASALAGR